MTARPLDLAKLTPGASAVVESINAEEPVAKRLADMGFVRGALITKLRSGRPGLVRIGATCVGMGLPLPRIAPTDVTDQAAIGAWQFCSAPVTITLFEIHNVAGLGSESRRRLSEVETTGPAPPTTRKMHAK